MGFIVSPTSGSTHGTAHAERELPRGALTTRRPDLDRRGRGALRRRRRMLNPLCLRSARGARVGADLQSRQAVHLVAAPLAGYEPRHRAGGGYLAVMGAGATPPGCCSRCPWRGHLGRRVRHLYALPDAGFDGSRGFGAPSSGWRAARHPARQAAARHHDPALALFDGRGFGAWYFAGWWWLPRSWSTAPARPPGDLSRLDAAFFTMNGVMSVTVFVFARSIGSCDEAAVRPPAPGKRRAAEEPPNRQSWELHSLVGGSMPHRAPCPMRCPSLAGRLTSGCFRI